MKKKMSNISHFTGTRLANRLKIFFFPNSHRNEVISFPFCRKKKGKKIVFSETERKTCDVKAIEKCKMTWNKIAYFVKSSPPKKREEEAKKKQTYFCCLTSNVNPFHIFHSKMNNVKYQNEKETNKKVFFSEKDLFIKYTVDIVAILISYSKFTIHLAVIPHPTNNITFSEWKRKHMNVAHQKLYLCMMHDARCMCVIWIITWTTKHFTFFCDLHKEFKLLFMQFLFAGISLFTELREFSTLFQVQLRNFDLFC